MIGPMLITLGRRCTISIISLHSEVVSKIKFHMVYETKTLYDKCGFTYSGKLSSHSRNVRTFESTLLLGNIHVLCLPVLLASFFSTPIVGPRGGPSVGHGCSVEHPILLPSSEKFGSDSSQSRYEIYPWNNLHPSKLGFLTNERKQQ